MSPARPLLAASALALALAAAPAPADITYLTQTRTIGASAGLGSGFPMVYNQTAQASDFGPFDESVEDEALIPDPSFPELIYRNYGYARQTSTLAVDSISWSGLVSGSDEYPFGGTGVGIGESILDVTFSVDQPSPYTFSGSISTAEAGMAFIGTARLSDSFDNTIYNPGGAINDFSTSGILQPGQYHLRLRVTNGAIGFSTGAASSTYSVSLVTIPGPGAALTLAAVPLALHGRRRRRLSTPPAPPPATR